MRYVSLLLLVLTVPTSARAGVLKYEMAGIVISSILMGRITNADTGLPIGTPVSFSFLVEDTAFDSGSTGFSERAFYDTFDFVGNFGNFHFTQISPSSPTADPLFVSNATETGFFDRLAGSSGAIVGNSVAGMAPRFAEFTLDDTSRSVFKNVAAPISVSASSFDSQFNQFFARDANSTVSVRTFYEVDSIEITRIPEPASLLLLSIISLYWSTLLRSRPSRFA